MNKVCIGSVLRTLLLVHTVNDLKEKMDKTASEICDINKELREFNDKTNKLNEGLDN